MSQTSEITAEKTPSYMGSPVVPQRIFDMFPKIQLIFVLCEPGPRTFSDYKYLMRTKVGTKNNYWLKYKFYYITVPFRHINNIVLWFLEFKTPGVIMKNLDVFLDSSQS